MPASVSVFVCSVSVCSVFVSVSLHPPLSVPFSVSLAMCLSLCVYSFYGVFLSFACPASFSDKIRILYILSHTLRFTLFILPNPRHLGISLLFFDCPLTLPCCSWCIIRRHSGDACEHTRRSGKLKPAVTSCTPLTMSLTRAQHRCAAVVESVKSQRGRLAFRNTDGTETQIHVHACTTYTHTVSLSLCLSVFLLVCLLLPRSVSLSSLFSSTFFS